MGARCPIIAVLVCSETPYVNAELLGLHIPQAIMASIGQNIGDVTKRVSDLAAAIKSLYPNRPLMQDQIVPELPPPVFRRTLSPTNRIRRMHQQHVLFHSVLGPTIKRSGEGGGSLENERVRWREGGVNRGRWHRLHSGWSLGCGMWVGSVVRFKHDIQSINSSSACRGGGIGGCLLYTSPSPRD